MNVVVSKRKEVNQKVKTYWNELKKSRSLELKVVKKNKVGSFTRHNGHRIARLKQVWRYPKGSHGNKLKVPSIGYKRPLLKRFRRKSDGLIFKLLYNEKQLETAVLKPYEVFMFSSKVGAKKRLALLTTLKEKNLPLYITK